VFVHDRSNRQILTAKTPKEESQESNHPSVPFQLKRRTQLSDTFAGPASRPVEQDSQHHELANLPILEARHVFTNYLLQERERYYPLGKPLTPAIKRTFERFFDPALLGQIRVHMLSGERISNPPFYKLAKEKGFRDLPNITHFTSVTFLDVIVFNERMTDRTLFHGLVQCMQVQILGVERYATLFLDGFIRTKSYFMVPLKAHAFALDCRFAENSARGFSVETEIVRSIESGSY